MVVKVNRAKLVSARYNKGMTVKMLSQKCGVSYQSIFNIENGRHTPNPMVLAKICKGLGIKPGDVIDVRDLETEPLEQATQA